MKNRIALLLFIGLALGQEYNPETGDDILLIRLKNGQKVQGGVYWYVYEPCPYTNGRKNNILCL